MIKGTDLEMGRLSWIIQKDPIISYELLKSKNLSQLQSEGDVTTTKKGPKNATLLALKSEEGGHELSDVRRFQKLEKARKGILLWSLQKKM